MADNSQAFSCPKCGFAQPEGTECARCGVIFARLRQAQPPQQAQPQQQEAPAQQTEAPPQQQAAQAPVKTPEGPPIQKKPGVDPVLDGAMRQLITGGAGKKGADAQPPEEVARQTGSAAVQPPVDRFAPLTLPVSAKLMWIRRGAGFLAMLFGVVLFVHVMDGASGPMNALLMIAYLAVGSVFLATSNSPILLRQLLLEMALFVSVTTALEIHSPVIFDFGRLTENKIKDRVPPGGPLLGEEDYLASLAIFVEESRAFTSGDKSRVDAVLSDFAALERVFSSVSDDVKVLVQAEHAKARELKDLVEAHQGNNIEASSLRKMKFLQDLLTP